MRDATSTPRTQREKIKRGKVISCPHEMTVRYFFERQPRKAIVDDIDAWVGRREKEICTHYWNDGGWSIKLIIRRNGHNAETLVDASIDFANLLKGHSLST